MRVSMLLLALGVAAGSLACSGDGGRGRPAAPASGTPTDGDATAVAEPALRDELLAMMREDQLERTGEGLPAGATLPPTRDYARSVRLRRIIADHGWPTHRLVGEDGATAAWLIAQHSDFDVGFQQEVVELMRRAVAEDQANPTELAYLEDRVAVNLDQPQRYGSQIRCRGGVPTPATPISDAEDVDARRAAVGLGMLDEYYDELATMCADESAEGQGPAT